MPGVLGALLFHTGGFDIPLVGAICFKKPNPHLFLLRRSNMF